jgi:dihydroorotate dehydrogenase electron transfer subunit
MPLREMGLVIDNQQLSTDLYQVDIKVSQVAQESCPGQFVHLKPGLTRDPLLRRPLSLFDVDKKTGTISILYKVVGQGTSLMIKAKSGDWLDILGPLGQGFSLVDKEGKVVLIGGGIGIAPLVFLARELMNRGQNISILYGADYKEQLVAADRIRAMGAELLISTMDGSAGHKGLVTDILYNQRRDLEKIEYIYCCGPELMMKEVVEYCKQRGIPGEVSLEEHMACGVGACLGCARKLNSRDREYAKVCKDGPVFPLNEVEFT